MRRPLLLLLVVIPFELTSAPAIAQQSPAQPASLRPAGEVAHRLPPLFRHGDVSRAWQATQTTGRPMLIFVTSDDCAYCKKMLRETFMHPQIQRGIVEYSEPVTFNASRSPELAKQLGVRAFPATLVISSEKELLQRVDGFVPAQEFAQRVWPALARSSARQEGAPDDGIGAR